MTDYIGNEIIVGSFITYPGAGNSTGEYGLILGQVTDITEGTPTKAAILGVKRLTKKYVNGNPIIGSRRTSLSNINKVVVTYPSENVAKVFNEPEKYAEFVATWLHGGSEILNWDDYSSKLMRV